MSTDKIPGGLAKGMSLSDIAKHHKLPLKPLQSKLEQGIKTEMEHTTDKAVAREIAMDHIYEDPNYYSKLKQIETEGTCGYTMDAETGEELGTPGGLEEGDKRGLDMYALELQKGLEEAILNHLLNEKDPKTGTGKKPKGSGRRLYTDEDPSDTVKVKFSTKQDIIDTLSKASFKSKSHARQSQIINLIHQRVRAAYERAKDPEVKKRLKTALDYAEQRKEASKEKTQRLQKIKEVEGSAIPYGSGYKELIPEITKFMLDKGMNLRPLPKVKFIEDDKENAEDVLGRTAFYNPEEKSVTLYTLGRHPKDILRSFCHEMIHHLQNVEDRLPKFYTTNTQEDSALNDIEEEAHRLGSMTMREFEDTIKK